MIRNVRRSLGEHIRFFFIPPNTGTFFFPHHFWEKTSFFGRNANTQTVFVLARCAVGGFFVREPPLRNTVSNRPGLKPRLNPLLSRPSPIMFHYIGNEVEIFNPDKNRYEIDLVRCPTEFEDGCLCSLPSEHKGPCSKWIVGPFNKTHQDTKGTNKAEKKIAFSNDTASQRSVTPEPGDLSTDMEEDEATAGPTGLQWCMPSFEVKCRCFIPRHFSAKLFGVPHCRCSDLNPDQCPRWFKNRLNRCACHIESDLHELRDSLEFLEGVFDAHLNNSNKKNNQRYIVLHALSRQHENKTPGALQPHFINAREVPKALSFSFIIMGNRHTVFCCRCPVQAFSQRNLQLVDGAEPELLAREFALGLRSLLSSSRSFETTFCWRETRFMATCVHAKTHMLQVPVPLENETSHAVH